MPMGRTRLYLHSIPVTIIDSALVAGRMENAFQAELMKLGSGLAREHNLTLWQICTSKFRGHLQGWLHIGTSMSLLAKQLTTA
jgi:hypothetical protein